MIALAIVGGYLLLGLFGARRIYRRLRPLRVPANCDKSILCNYGAGPHYKSGSYEPCYRSPLGVKWSVDKGEVVPFSLLLGLGWPVIFLCAGLKWAVTVGNDGQQPVELEAHIAELERELGMRGK